MKKYLLMMMSCIFLMNCSGPEQDTHQEIHLVKEDTLKTVLNYSGIIQPIKTVVVPSPADGVIVEMPFQYGESVAAGKLLFMLSSKKFLSDYKTALMEYLKAKNEFNNNKNQLSEASFLHKNELISDDDFKHKQSAYYASQLTFLQSKDVLENLLDQLDTKKINLYDLTIADVDKINQALHIQKHSENLRVITPVDGIILSPSKSEDESKKIAVGDVVKQGDVLAIIGDLGGFSVRIKVNELVINQLRYGQKVKISGLAFIDEVLEGFIRRLDKQGDGANGGLPTFFVEVIVPKISRKQRDIIHVGMSAQVEIAIEDEPRIIIPMEALHEKNGKFFVDVYDEVTKKTVPRLVSTGKTTMNAAAIIAGLKVGEKIVLSH